MKNSKYLILIINLFCLNVFAQTNNTDFLELLKKTGSVYSGVINITADSPGNVQFETIMNNQKVFFSLASYRLDTTVLTVINNDSPNQSKKHFPPVDMYLEDVQILLNGTNQPTPTCDGSGFTEYEPTFNCSGKNCTISQRVVSLCNETNCWMNEPTTDRDLVYAMMPLGGFEAGKVDITDCIPSNVAGSKYNISFQHVDLNNKSGGTLSYSIFLKNESDISNKNGIKVRK